ncbi:hypothetical protein pb186bvf_006892 [Paramecium bursaria]
MLRNIQKIIYQQSRFFIITIDKPIETQSLFDQGKIIFGAQKDQQYFYLFNCQDEMLPYDVIKESHKDCQFKIEELEMKDKGLSKQLAQLYKFR